MTRAIDKMRSVYRESLRPLELKEMGLTLYFGTLTQSDIDAVAERMADAGRDPANKANASDRHYHLLVHMAKTEDGTPAFEPGDMHYLKSEVAHDTMQDILNFMYKSASRAADTEEGKGELEPTTGSAGDSISPTTGSAASAT